MWPKVQEVKLALYVNEAELQWGFKKLFTVAMKTKNFHTQALSLALG